MSEKSFARIGYFSEGAFKETQLRARDVFDSKGVSVEAHQTNTAAHVDAARAMLIDGAIQSTEKGVANGVATLGADGQLNPAQIDLTAYQAKVNAATYADMLALDTTAKNGCPVNNYVFVTDATGDETVKTGWAIYRRTSAGNTAADFVKTSEGESIDVVLPDFEAMDIRITANETAAATAQSSANFAQSTANLAASDAAKLDFAFCADEADMISKNLREGAMVLMSVDNE